MSSEHMNTIPLERPTNLKRQRPDEESNHDDDDDDDHMSLISRSPSPTSHNNDMDVDQANIQKYDEHIDKPAREVITVHSKIKPSNKGFTLLTKLGWQEGQPVGLSADGRTEPVPFFIKSDLTGLGKTTLDFQMIETTVSQRRELDSERQTRETEEQRKLREDSAARKSALKAEISSTLKSFYCELCEKQFKTVAQYDEHTNSYAHHHKSRFKIMQTTNRMNPQDLDKRKEKERKREEKELRKMAAASGVKIPKAQTLEVTATTSDLPSHVVDDPMHSPIPENCGSRPNISSGPSNAPSSTAGFKKAGWAVVGTPTTSTLSNIPSPAPPPTTVSPLHNTAFHNAGWATLETGHANDMLVSHPSPSGTPMSVGTAALAAPLPSPSPVALPTSNPGRSSWQQFQKGRRK